MPMAPWARLRVSMASRSGWMRWMASRERIGAKILCRPVEAICTGICSASTRSSGAIPRTAATGSGGRVAPNCGRFWLIVTSPSFATQMRWGPASVSIVYSPGSTAPCSASRCQVAMVAWPHRRTSAVVAKKRTRRSQSCEGRTKAVSDIPISAAMACIVGTLSPSASTTTPAGFPPIPLRVNALTVNVSTLASVGGEQTRT
jgi:hypothetical protein